MSSFDKAIDAADDLVVKIRSSSEAAASSNRQAKQLLQRFRRSYRNEDIEQAKDAAQKAVLETPATDPKRDDYLESLEIIRLHADWCEAKGEKYYDRLPKADDSQEQVEKREHLRFAKRVALADDYVGVFNEPRWKIRAHGRDCRGKECKGKGAAPRSGPYFESWKWLNDFDDAFNWDLPAIIQHITWMSAFPEAYIAPIHESSIQDLGYTASLLKERIRARALHGGSSSDGKLKPDIVCYFEEPVCLFTAYDHLGFIISVTAIPSRESNELDFYLPLIALYAKWCTLLASTCVHGTAYSDHLSPYTDVVKPFEALEKNHLVPFMVHIAVIPHPTIVGEDGVLLGSTLGLMIFRGPSDPSILDSSAWSVIEHERKILQHVGFKRPDGDHGKNFGQCAETVFLELGMRLQNKHRFYDILRDAWGFALQLKHTTQRHAPGRLKEGVNPGQEALAEAEPIRMMVTATQYDQSFFLSLLRDPCVTCQSLFDQMSRRDKRDVWKDGFEARLVEESIRSGRLRPIDLDSRDFQQVHFSSPEQDQQGLDQQGTERTQGTPTRSLRIEKDSFFGPHPRLVPVDLHAPSDRQCTVEYEVRTRSPFAARKQGFKAKNYPRSVKGLPYRPRGETKTCKDRYSKHIVSCSGWTLDLSNGQWLACGSPSTQHSRIAPESKYSAEPFLIQQEFFGEGAPLGGLCTIIQTGERVMCRGWTGPPKVRLWCGGPFSPHEQEETFDVRVFDFELPGGEGKKN